MRKYQQRVAVFCRCGASWFGRFAVDNPVIESHRNRCGQPITSEAFAARGYRVKWPREWTSDEREAVTTGRLAEQGRAE